MIKYTLKVIWTSVIGSLGVIATGVVGTILAAVLLDLFGATDNTFGEMLAVLQNIDALLEDALKSLEE